MPITEEQRKARKNFLGSSDAAAIMGRDPWRSRTDVYHEKTLDLGAVEPTEAMQNGNRLESALVAYAEERLGVTITANVNVVSGGIDGGIMAANMDGIVDGGTAGCECKFVGPTNADDWGEDGSDAVPQHVAIQCQHQMAVCGPVMTRVWVPAFIAISFRPEWRLFCVPRNQDIIDVLTSQLTPGGTIPMWGTDGSVVSQGNWMSVTKDIMVSPVLHVDLRPIQLVQVRLQSGYFEAP